MTLNQTLPEPLPEDPLQIAADWLAEALQVRNQPNPDAMVLATCDSSGQPSARTVLCKGIEVGAGRVQFVSNYESRKGRELAANPKAALVMHWDHSHRQVRMEGLVQRATPAQSDAYFARRHRASQLGAVASRQSEPVPSRAQLIEQLEAVTERYGLVPPPEGKSVPRPDHWGGYVFWVAAVELWMEGTARIHDRARWTRALRLVDDVRIEAGPWQATRLQP
jgi:pyridoxamine 5'-phosphate oxidase